MPAQDAYRANLFFDNTSGTDGYIENVTDYTAPRPTINTVESTPLQPQNRLQQVRRVANSVREGEGSITVEYDVNDDIHAMMAIAGRRQTTHTIKQRTWPTDAIAPFNERAWNVKFTSMTEDSSPGNASILATFDFYALNPVGPVWELPLLLSMVASSTKTYDLSKFSAGYGLVYTVQATTPSSNAFASGSISGNTLTITSHATNTQVTTMTIRGTDADSNFNDTQIVVSPA